MVRLLALLFSFWTGPALAQADFTTVISPTTLGTSPLAVTLPVSPSSVICISGCAAGASPSSVIITNTVTTSPVAGSIFVVVGTVTTSAVNTSTAIPVSLTAGTTVTQGTSPWGIAGGVNVNNTVTTSLNGNVGINGTITTSSVNTSNATPVTVSGTVTTSSVNTSNATPVTVSGTLTTSSVNTSNATPVTVSGTVTTSPVNATIPVSMNVLSVVPTTSPLAVSLPGSPAMVTVTSAAVVPVMAAGTSPVAITLAVSPLAVSLPGSPANVTTITSPGVFEQTGSAYPNRAAWVTGSVSMASVNTNTVLVNQVGTNKLYITDLVCGRSDNANTATTSQSTAVISLNTATSVLFSIGAAGRSNTANFKTPLVTAASTSLQIAQVNPATAISIQCFATGYAEP